MGQPGGTLPSSDMDRRADLVASLSRAIFMRESQNAARDYEALTGMEEDFRLEGNLQHDLARLLELGNEPRLGLHAYEQILAHDEEHPLYAQSLRAAGHLSYRLKSHKKCRRYLELFLKGKPPASEAQDAESILNRLPDGKGIPKRSIVVSDQARSVPLPQPSLEDSQTEDVALSSLPTESNFEELIAIGSIREETTDQVISSQATPNKLTFDSTAPEIEHLLQREDSPQEEEFFGAPEEPVGEPESPVEDEGSIFGAPEPLSDLAVVEELNDPFAETPALSISARDVVRKMAEPELRDLKPGKRRKGPGDTTGWARDPVRRRINTDEEAGGDHPSSSAALYEALRDEEFAMLLPVGEKIILDQVVSALMATESLAEADARLAVLERKGLIRERLTIEEVAEIWPKIRRLRQQFIFVRVPSGTRVSVVYDASRTSVLKPGLKMNTQAGVLKVKWEDIRMLSCGRLNRQPAVEIFAGNPTQHYRLLQGRMDFLEIEGIAGDPSDACRDFLMEITRKAPDAVHSHTVRNFLSGRNWRPQKFPDANEYDRYNLCLLYAHFGEAVDAAAISDMVAEAG